MKKVLGIGLAALAFVGCAPASNLSSYGLEFAPASPLGAQVTGTGSYVSVADGKSRVKLELRGLPANAVLGSALMVGSCTNQGHIAAAMPDIRSDANGNATLETTVRNGLLPVQAYVNVYQKTQADGYGTALACANIK